MLEQKFQPSLNSLIQRMSHELSAKSVLLLREDGQVMARSGWMEENEIPIMAALVVAVAAASKPLQALGDHEENENEVRINCESEFTGLYILPIQEGLWLATLYDQPLNPGLFRMKVRRYAETIKRLGGKTLVDQYHDSDFSETGATLTPIVRQNSTLFENITDEEIDNLFAGSDQ